MVKRDGTGHEDTKFSDGMKVGRNGFKPTDVAIDLEDKQEAEKIGELTRLMYDRRFVVEYM